MLSFLFFSISRAWQGFWRNAAMSLAATATMILMLLLLACFWIVQAGFLASLDSRRGEGRASSRTSQDDTPSQVDQLVSRHGSTRCPRSARSSTSSKDEALARFREQRKAQGQRT